MRVPAFLVTIALSVSSAVAQDAPTIRTIAGGGPDQIPATEANLIWPNGVTTDTAGNVYIAVATSPFGVGNPIFALSGLSHRIFKLTPGGDLVLVAGDGLAGFTADGGFAADARFDTPRGIAIDLDGSILVADSENNRIRRIRGRIPVVTTVAGRGGYGFYGDGGAATSASLSRPSGVAVDAAGDIYIADGGNSRVRRVDHATGIITTIAGTGATTDTGDGGPAVDAGVSFPESVAVSGNVLVIDTGLRIRRVDLVSGLITTIAGGGSPPGNGNGDGGLAVNARIDLSRSLAVDGGGNVYVAEESGNRVRRIDAATGIITTVAGTGVAGTSGDGGPATAARLRQPIGVAVDPNGNILIADTANHRLRRVDATTGMIETIAGDGFPSFGGDGHPAIRAGLGGPSHVAVDSGGQLYIADAEPGRVRRVDLVTGIITTVASGLAGIRSVIPDGHGGAIVAECGVTVRRIDLATGEKTLVAGGGSDGGEGVPATSASLNCPSGLALDRAGNLLIADNGHNRVRRVDSSTGTISTIAGAGTGDFSGDGGQALEAELHFPEGLAVDSAGNVYIADSFNSRIRRVDAATGIITTVAGSAVRGAFGDGHAATSAGLSSPSDIAFDGGGNLFIADLGDDRIRRVDVTSGIITTVAGSGDSGDFGGDRGAATGALLNQPSGVALDTSGNLYIADRLNHRVREVALVGEPLLDGIAPVTVASVSPAANSANWHRTSTTVTLDATDNAGGSGVATIAYAASGAQSIPNSIVNGSTASVVLSHEGHTTLSFHATDEATNEETSKSLAIHIDKTPPVVSCAAADHAWHASDVAVACTAGDGVSGLALPSDASLMLTTNVPPGTETADAGTFAQAVCDLADNCTLAGPVHGNKVDKKPPHLTAEVLDAANAAGWHDRDVPLRFTCVDFGSGVESLAASGAAEGSGPSPLELVVQEEGAGLHIGATCSDGVLNRSSVTVSGLNIDKTPPTVSSSRSPSPNAEGWNNTDVRVRFEAADALSGVVGSSSLDVLISEEGAGQSATGTFADRAGNTGRAVVEGINVDKTRPVVTASPSRPPDANDWYNQPLDVVWSATDSLSGVSACDPVTHYGGPDTPTVGHQVTGACTDRAGNQGSAVFNVRFDATPPEIGATRTPPPNAYGWNHTDVAIDFTCTDGASGVLGAGPTDVVLSSEGAAQSATGACQDVAGNRASMTVGGIDIDKTAPMVTGTASRVPDSNGWYNHGFEVVWSAHDTLSGVAGCDPAAAYSGPDTMTGTVAGACRDRAGNGGSATYGFLYDATPPAITITQPAEGATFLLNQGVGASYTCGDALSGLASCAGPVASGAPLVTGTVGPAPFTVAATDAAGNGAAATHTYTVVYAFQGFFAPLSNLPTTNRGTAGRTYPVKWRLADANGVIVSDTASLADIAVVPAACGTMTTDVAGEEDTLDLSSIKFDPLTGEWHFNWKTAKTQAGCFLLEVRLADGTVHRAAFELR